MDEQCCPGETRVHVEHKTEPEGQGLPMVLETQSFLTALLHQKDFNPHYLPSALYVVSP